MQLNFVKFIFCYRFINIEPSAVDEERVAAENDNEGRNLTLTDKVVQAATISETSSPNLEITNASTSPPLSTNIWDGLVTEPPDVS